MNKHLIKDLHSLIDAQIITPEIASSIQDYYRRKQDEAPNRLTTILAILGSLLVGGGILLAIAHNWDDFSKLLRTVLAFTPLIIAQILGVYALIKKNTSSAWKESAAIALFAASGASISLISQIYQINGSLSGFVLMWTFLCIPLIYIFSSSAVSLLCMAAATWYACLVGYSGDRSVMPYPYVIVLLCILPYFLARFKQNAESNFIHFFQWTFVISITFALGAFTMITRSWYHWGPTLYCTLFCFFAVLGRTNFFNRKSLLKNPYLVVGVPGLLFLLFIASFRLTYYGDNIFEELSFSDPLPYLLILLIGLMIYLIFSTMQGALKLPNPEIFSCVVIFLAIIVLRNNPPTPQILVNGWILAICCFYIVKGAKENSLPIMNFGLIVLAILAICRFFDDDIPFVWRSLFFVTVGVGFFVANLLVIRKRKAIKI